MTGLSIFTQAGFAFDPLRLIYYLFLYYFWSMKMLGPIDVAIATLLMYCPFAAAGFAFIIAFIIVS